MRTAVLVLVALALVLGPVLATAPPASACIQVYPLSALCGNPAAGAKKVVCWETDGAVCIP